MKKPPLVYYITFRPPDSFPKTTKGSAFPNIVNEVYLSNDVKALFPYYTIMQFHAYIMKLQRAESSVASHGLP